MQIQAIRTHKITVKDTDLFAILDKYLPALTENSVIAVTSKIISLTERQVRDPASVTKDELVHEQADWYIPRDTNPYHYCLSIKNSILISSAGIDQSNSDGHYVLWPKDVQASANKIRAHLAAKHHCKHLGVIITDSQSVPMRRGVQGTALAHSGFRALNSYIDTPDLFERHLNVTKANVMTSLAAAAVAVMGEGNEQTPLALITEVPFVHFVEHNPPKEELDELHIRMDDDVFAPLLTKGNWQQGRSGK